MLRPPSQQREYDEFYSGDPAFVQAPEMPPDDAPPEHIAAAVAARKEHTHRITVARETGDWSQLIVEGETPTRFVMRPLGGELHRHLADLITSGTIGAAISNHIVFRAALRSVAGLGDLQVKLALPENPALRVLGKIATAEIPNALDALDKDIVNELALVAFNKAGTSPK